MTDLMTPADYLAFAEVPPDERIAYGTDPSQFGELYLPRGPGRFPAVVLLHGGCWRDGLGLGPLGQLARAIADLGFVVWNVEYRRLGGGGGWPHTFEDVATAADSLVELATRYPIDLGRVLAAGHSAGGHLALWLRARHRLGPDATLYRSEPLAIKGVLSLAGIPDLPAALDAGICNGAPGELVGGTPQAFQARYGEASPHAQLPLGIPHVHVVGTDDALVPATYVADFVEQARAAGDAVSLHQLDGAGHFEIVDRRTFAWATLASALHELAGD